MFMSRLHCITTLSPHHPIISVYYAKLQLFNLIPLVSCDPFSSHFVQIKRTYTICMCVNNYIIIAEQKVARVSEQVQYASALKHFYDFFIMALRARRCSYGKIQIWSKTFAKFNSDFLLLLFCAVRRCI